MDANLNGALAMVSSSGSPKSCVGSRHSGALFLRTFFLGMQKEGTRHKDETNNKKVLDSRMRGNDHYSDLRHSHAWESSNLTRFRIIPTGLPTRM